jgi:hypothetical protein
MDKGNRIEGLRPAVASIDQGGSAFPNTEVYSDGCGMRQGTDGMTLRDYFAAKALAGILASGLDHIDGGGDNSDWRRFSALAYRYADAMIAARHPQSPASPPGREMK